MKETKIDIDKPKLIQEKEYLNANYNNQVELKHIPYASNARTISQFSILFYTNLYSNLNYLIAGIL